MLLTKKASQARDVVLGLAQSGRCRALDGDS
jgi:hypothetical protein